MPDRTLTLTCPLVVFDLETTGLDPASDRIVEIGCVKLLPGKGAGAPAREVRTWRVNPGRPIPPAATQIHGITDADVATSPTFDALAREVHAYLEGCDLSGFHVEAFDMPLLAHEFERVGIDFPSWSPRIVDTRTLFVLREPRGLAAALSFYCGREHVGAHGAEADAVASADVLLAQIARYPDLPASVDALHAACHPVAPDAVDAAGKVRWVGGEAVLGFGKHTGKPLRQRAADTPDYLRWIMGADFPPDTKRIIGDALAGRFPAAPAAPA
ncbi:MAG: 3'-5' exonuclease [Planctomycetota bacterium]|jgi:DNA polymerase-3 subunit epsilon